MLYFKFRFFVLFLITIGSGQLYGYGVGQQWYADEFGPLQTGYTMGDLVRYTATPGLNVYSDMVVPPAGAQDIYNFGQNTYNLYNTLGYLYAGWALFNSSTFTDLEKWATSFRQVKGGARELFDNNQNCRNTIEFNVTPAYQNVKNAPIGTAYSQDQLQAIASGAQNNDWSLKGLANFNPTGGDSTNAFTTLFGHYHHNNLYNGQYVIDNTSLPASGSCGWCSNASNGDMMMYFVDPSLQKYEQLPVLTGNLQGHGIAGGRVYPTGQFFGARIAHILGSVVNDVPWSDDLSSSNASGGTGAFTNPLISGSRTTLPMFAVLNGNTANYTTSNAPKGMIQPSTAHFGSMQTFLSKLSLSPEVQQSLGNFYNYLINHFSPTINRLSTLASYTISSLTNSENLIKISDNNITSYDNGVIVAIQNNTGDQLTVNQVTSQASSSIGILNTGNNNYFLHTASLVPNQSSTGSSSSGSSSSTETASVTPVASNMISIVDQAINNISAYIQILNADQLQVLVQAINTTLSSTILQSSSLPPLNYDQITLNNYKVPTNLPPSYVVITNFNPILDSNNTLSNLNLPKDPNSKAQILNSFRIQAVNVAEFDQKPYFLTLQINKEAVGYGVQTEYKKDSSGNPIEDAQGNYVVSGYSLSKGSSNSYILYPSIVSCNVCKWQNVAHVVDGNDSYSYIPLLMIPEVVKSALITEANKELKGFNPYYIIWLMSYAAAMTECSYNKAVFGDLLSVCDKVFNLFQASNNQFTFQGSATKQISRVVVDQNQNLASGQLLELDNGIFICGCDTWDSGGGFNQDIPIVNLSVKQDANGNNSIIPNELSNPYVNLIATFGTQNTITNPTDASSTFEQAYGLPYSNSMIFSVPINALKNGINMQLSQTTDGGYQLIVSPAKEYTDNNGDTIQAGAILAAPKIVMDSSTTFTGNIEVDFLRTKGDTTWKSPLQIQIPTALEKNFNFTVTYTANNNQNILEYKISNQDVLKSATLYSFDLKQNGITSFYFNTNNFSYSFISNPWNSLEPVSADISSIIQGKNYFKILVKAFDSNNKILFDITNNQKIDHFEIYFFDEKDKELGKSIAVPLTSCYPIGSKAVNKQDIISDIGSYFNLGVESTANGLAANVNEAITYPFALEFKNINTAKISLLSKSVSWAGDVRWVSGGTTPLQNPPSAFEVPFLFFISSKNTMGEISSPIEYQLLKVSSELVFATSDVLNKLPGNYVKYDIGKPFVSLEQIIIQSGSNPYIKTFMAEDAGVSYYVTQSITPPYGKIPYAESYYIWDGLSYLNTFISKLGADEYVSLQYISGTKFGISLKSITSAPKVSTLTPKTSAKVAKVSTKVSKGSSPAPKVSTPKASTVIPKAPVVSAKASATVPKAQVIKIPAPALKVSTSKIPTLKK